jgi:hypothetical protein
MVKGSSRRTVVSRTSLADSGGPSDTVYLFVVVELIE